MLYNFLSNCKCALDEEAEDYCEAIDKISHIPACVGFMPAITDDLYPVFALSCTSAKQIVSPNIYVIPVGAHDFWAKPYFEQIVNDFYQDDEIQEQFGIELEEMILLVSPDINQLFRLNEKTFYNVIYCQISLPGGEEKYLIFVLDTPHGCWKKIIEAYNTKCEILIDSHKGMGGWFENIPLYKVMRETEIPVLLPRYYFKGLYISHEAPPGFNLLYTIPDAIAFNEKPIDSWQKEIYEIDWEENKKISD